MLSFAVILIFIPKTTVEKKRLRLYSVYLLLVIVLGPGLLINGVIKGYASRPRPGDTITLGGAQQYVPPLQVGNSLLFKSFPSGHAASAFMFVGFFFLFRHRRRKLALFALGGSIFFGLLMGSARIMQGGHYLSDILWAGFLTYLTALVIYYFLLRVPLREEVIETGDPGRLKPFSKITKSAISVVLLSMITANLIALPFAEKVTQQIASEHINKDTIINYSFDLGDIAIRFDKRPGVTLSIDGLADGYGFPTSHVKTSSNQVDNELNVSLEHKGLYAELISYYNLNVNLDSISGLNLNTQDGSITVHGPVTEEQKAKLQLKAVGGEVIWK